MKAPISRELHGVADYIYAAFVPAAPHLFGFSKRKVPTALCYSLGSGALLYTLLTKAEWGVYPVLPFRAHLAIDSAANLMAVASPWLLGFANRKKARNTILAIGAAGLLISLLTQKQEMNEPAAV